MRRQFSKIIAVAAALSAASVALGLTQAAAQDEVIVLPFRYEHWEHPKDLGDVLRETLESEEGQAILGAIAAAYGVSPQVVSGAIAIINATRQTERGETRRYEAAVPSGYKFCNAHKVRKSESSPNSQSDSTIFNLFLDPSGQVLKWNSYAKREGLGGGRSWVRRSFDLVFVRSDIISDFNCTKLGLYKGVTPMIFRAEDAGPPEMDYTLPPL